MKPMQTATLTLDQALQQALTYHQAGQLREAESLYRAILKAHPNQADTHHNLGVLAAQVNPSAAGLPHFKEALEANPDKAQYWLSYIDALLQAGQTADARHTLEQGLQRGLQGKAVEALAVRLAGAAQLVERSSADHQQAPKALPNFPVLASENNKKKSKTISSQQTGKGPSPQDIGALGVLFWGGQYEEAASQAQAITVDYPQHGLSWKVLGAALKQTGRSEEALVAMQKAVVLLPGDAEAHVNLGLILSDIGRLREAEASHRRALEIKPNYVEAHCKLGNVLKDLGRLSEAEASYQCALRVNPNLADVHNNLGATLKDLGRLDEAEACYRRALELKWDYVEGHYNLGNVLKEMGRLSEAETSYQCALRVNPNLADVHNNLGATLKDLGRLDEAEACYRRALLIKPDFVLALCNLGIALRDMGKLPSAVACFRQALDLKSVSHDSLVAAHIGLADTLARLVSGWHVPMMNDLLRNKAYQDALRTVVTPETNALEIGTGSGLLAMMTARFGAGQITTCEAVPFIAANAQEIIEANDLTSFIRVIPKKSTEIQVGGDLPQRANLLVSEIFSSELLGE
jgi:protein O-GlcNAc transferase